MIQKVSITKMKNSVIFASVILCEVIEMKYGRGGGEDCIYKCRYPLTKYCPIRSYFFSGITPVNIILLAQASFGCADQHLLKVTPLSNS